MVEQEEQQSKWWNTFLTQVGIKTKSLNENPRKLAIALNNASYHPTIYCGFGVHGGILFPDAGYCEFDDPEIAWQHIQRWIRFAKLAHRPTKEWTEALPVSFEIGVNSLEEFAKTYPIWEALKKADVEIVNPLYSQPYLRQIGEESNFRQFQNGIKRINAQGIATNVFASSEHAFHPQLPQLLKGFGIERVIISVRLAGGGPTSYQPKIEWVGPDGTSILAIISQSGLMNGHIWHGKFFEELPALLFNAVARPDLKDVVYINIEDFANPLPGAAEVALNIQECEKNRIYFRSFSQLVDSPQIPVSRKAVFQIDDFPIREMTSKLITAARTCEDWLINVEASFIIASSLFNLIPEQKQDGIEKKFSEAWQNLLISQNHDAFVVPFTTPGMYSQMQGLHIQKTWTTSETIEEKSLHLIMDANEIVKTILAEFQKDQEREFGKPVEPQPEQEPMTRFYFNFLWDRIEIVEGKTINLPGMGYCAENYLNEKKYENENKHENLNEIMLDLPKVESQSPTKIKIKTILLELDQDCSKISFSEGNTTLFLKSPKWNMSWTNAGFRYDCHLTCEHEMIFKIHTPINKNIFITYPFGAEKTDYYTGHSLRFIWLENEYVFAHSGTPYYERHESTLNIKIPAGTYQFSFAKAITLIEAYQRAWEFFYPPLSISIPTAKISSFGKNSRNQLVTRMNYQGCVPIALYRVKNKNYLRVLSVDGSKPHLPNTIEVDFYHHPISQSDSQKGRAWGIYCFQILS
jgi:hypothetical protein